MQLSRVSVSRVDTIGGPEEHETRGPGSLYPVSWARAQEGTAEQVDPRFTFSSQGVNFESEALSDH